VKVLSKACAALAVASVLATGSAVAPAIAQEAAQPVAVTNPLGLPTDISIFDTDNPNKRGATAMVNGYVITGTDISQRVALVTSASQTEVSADEMKRLQLQVLRNVIDETLKIQAAAAQEIPATRAEVEKTYAQLAAQNFGQEPQKMDEYLAQIGSSSNALKRQIEGELAWENLLRRNVTPFVNVAEEEVQERLRRLQEAKGTDEYRLGEIFLSATSENREAVLSNARQIIEQLQQGGSFVAYARQFSEASTAAVGGDTGFLRLETLPPALAQAAQQMQNGQLVGPLEIPGGFSILYLIDKRKILTADPRDATLALKQISIDFPQDVDQAAAEARVNEFATFVQSLRGCADADARGAAFGATVVTNDEIKARQLPDQLQKLVLDLQVGQSTQAFGSPQDGIRVLMLCGRDDPEDAGLPTADEIENQIRSERIEKRAQRYLRDLRHDAYIEYN
jgi:peptidyl-prolyl cis-trans isomerase SurA